VEVLADADGYAITQQRRGDTTDVMLDYVGYSLADLRASYAARVAAADLSPARAQELSEALEAGLTGYTYLSDEPLA
jgi:arginine decarboxylase